MWRMLQHDVPEDYVIATGRSHVRDFLEVAFARLGLDWRTALIPIHAIWWPAEVDHPRG